MLFSKIVPNLKKLGLLDAGDGWLRTKFTELGAIAFEDWADSEEEVAMFQLAEGEIAIRLSLPVRSPPRCSGPRPRHRLGSPTHLLLTFGP